MSGGEIAKRLLSPSFREFSLGHILKAVGKSRSRADLGFGLLMPSVFIADLSNELKSLAKRASSQDGTVRNLLHDEILEVQLNETKNELKEALERLEMFERSQSLLKEENSRLSEVIEEFEQSRISARINVAETSARANEVIEVSVVRKWVATLGPVYAEIDRIEEPHRTRLREKLTSELELRGLKPVDLIGQIVEIDPMKHDVLGSSPSGRGQVIELGWMWKGNDSEILVSKSVVLPE